MRDGQGGRQCGRGRSVTNADRVRGRGDKMRSCPKRRGATAGGAAGRQRRKEIGTSSEKNEPTDLEPHATPPRPFSISLPHLVRPFVWRFSCGVGSRCGRFANCLRSVAKRRIVRYCRCRSTGLIQDLYQKKKKKKHAHTKRSSISKCEHFPKRNRVTSSLSDPLERAEAMFMSARDSARLPEDLHKS